MAIATVSSKGWIVIPKEIRDRFGIKPGDKVQVIDYGGIYIVPALKDPAKQMRGMFKNGPSLTEALLQDRREEHEREEQKMSRQSKPRKKAS